MKAIHKQPLSEWLDMPKGSRLLCVQNQRDTMCIWYECDAEAPDVRRHLAIFGTGWEMPDEPMIYVGTVQQNALVWHVYDLGESGPA